VAQELFEREPRNPIITIADLPYPANAVFNPGVVEMAGRVVLLLRVEDRQGRSHLTVARSENGVDNWKIDPQPLIAPDPDSPLYPYESFGCEDPRITWLPELGVYAICYTAYSPFGPGVAVATTKDFVSVCRMGLILQPNNKDAAMFPRRFNDRWVMLHRPVSGAIEHIWLTSSPDLVHWGAPTHLVPERGGPWWDGARVGAGAPPIETPDGWFLIYHGVKTTASGALYRLGMALADRDDPSRLLARYNSWILSPIESYERLGDVPNVVYTCGAIVRGDHVWLYYGGADTCVCLARARLDHLLEQIRANPAPQGPGSAQQP